MYWVYKYSFLGIVCLLLACFQPLQAQLSLQQGDIETQIIHNSQSILQFPTEFFLALGSDKGLRVKEKFGSYHFKGKFKPSCKQSYIEATEQKEKTLLIKGGFRDCPCQFSWRFEAQDDGAVAWTLEHNDSSLHYMRIRYSQDSSKHYYGFGQQYSHFDMQGKRVPIFTQESGIGRGDMPLSRNTRLLGVAGNEFTTHYGLPYYIELAQGAKHYPVFFLENKAYTVFDFSKEEEVQLELWSSKAQGRIWLADSPLEAVELYTAHTGRLPQPADWIYGTCLGLQGGADRCRRIVKEAKAAGNPISAIWIQDWVGKRKTRLGSQLWWSWKVDEQSYPDFKAFCQEMEGQGVSVLGYINPFLANEGPFFEEAKEKGYLVKDHKGEDYKIPTGGFPAYLVDLTNPEACRWLKEIIKKNMIAPGMKGWMSDFAEGLPLDAQLHSGVDAHVYHNQYPVDFARINREAIQEAGMEGKISFFSRSGSAYSNKYITLFWLGDQIVSWQKQDGIASTVPALLSSGLSGISINHSDIGGYTTMVYWWMKNYQRSEELLARWAELNAFTGVFRTHEGLIPEQNAQVYSNANTVAAFSKMGQLHRKLQPYLQHCVEEATTKGYPLVRPLLMHYPQDRNTYALDRQFLLGEDLLVLPVLEQGADKVKGYFPEGQWQNIWTGELVEGGLQRVVAAPLGQPAAYIRMGGAWTERLQEQLLKAKYEDIKR